MLKQTFSNNAVFRIDSQYFLKKYMQEDIYIKKYVTRNLGEISYITDGQHGYHEVDNNSVINHITAKNAKGWFVNSVGADKIAKWVNDKNKRSSLKENDLILSTRGTVGLCAMVDIDVLPANIDQDVARINFSDNIFYPYCVLAYINSKFGQDWIFKNKTGMVQQGLALWRLKDMPVPIFDNTFQIKIKKIIDKAKKYKNLANGSYVKAESLLLDTLGLRDFKPSKESISIKKLSESFYKTGRLDAEYYQRKYEDYEIFISNYSNGFNKLSEICCLKDKNFEPSNEDYYSYIELSDVDSLGSICSNDKIFGKDLPSRARRLVSESDVLISSIEGSLQSCAVIPKNLNNALCSTGFYVLNSSIINSETLLMLFKTSLMQNLLKKNCSGTILTAINKVDFLDIPIPLIDTATQSQIKAFMQESFTLKAESKRLLDLAKQAVETAIEQDEQAAVKLLEEQGGRAG